MQNVAKISSNLTREFTYTYESTIKISLSEWDRAIPLIKELRLSCMTDNLMKCDNKG